MYKGNYVPWDNYPIYLRFDEIQRPIKALEKFFGERLESHREELKMWRDLTISDKQYLDKKHGSGHLLFIHDENIKLLEACYVLLQEYRNEPWNKKFVTQEILDLGKSQWPNFPDVLSDKELLNPYLVLKKIFKKTSLPFFREYLKEWAHAALYKHSVDEILMPGEMILLYENILKIYAAAYIIHQTESSKPILKKLVKNNDNDLASKVLSFKIREFSPDISVINSEKFLPQIGQLLNTLPSVRSITYLGSQSSPLFVYLLILVDDTDLTSELNITNKLEHCYSRFAKLHVIVHKVSTAIEGLNNDIRFWHLALGQGVNIFRTVNLQLPQPKMVSGELDVAVRLANWNKWGIISHAFLQGAESYYKNNNVKSALFLLNQATEFILIGLIQMFLGYRPSGHNLWKNIRLTLLFTDEINEVLKGNSEEDDKMLIMLQNGYSKARYDPNFIIDDSLLELAIGKVGLLINKAKVAFNI